MLEQPRSEKPGLSRRQRANVLRILSADAVQLANSGHPGGPMGMADIMQVLWQDFLRHNPSHPHWPNRDRFVLSNGHSAILLYAILHLCGYPLSMYDLKQFRKLDSKTPGHPEYGCTPGVEVTTGPLGQGLANAVGMALAERTLARQFNRGTFNIVDHHTYFLVGDGCLMEGISHEACSLAGTQRLGKLVGLFDSNRISIDGDVRAWCTDDTAGRFEAYGWHVVRDIDGHQADAIRDALEQAVAETTRPSLICCNTVIGWGAPNKQDTAACHGAPLGEKEIALLRETLGWEHAPFEIPEGYYAAWDARQKGRQWEAEWDAMFSRYRQAHATLAAEFLRRTQGDLPDEWSDRSRVYVCGAAKGTEAMASRQASQDALNAYGPVLPELIGGSADLTASNLTYWKGARPISAQQADGNYLYYGVREFAMAAINNGIAVHGGFIPYGGTFLVFSEYARNALRMAALMKLRTVFVFTHDSIGLGEDGPTHQAVEQAASLRLMPNMSVWRPCDAAETAVAWKLSIERADGPSSLLLSRQSLPQQTRTGKQVANIAKGGYILFESGLSPRLIIIATGSEVSLAYNLALYLAQQGHAVRLVSMPSTDVFDRQTQAYQDAVLPPGPTRRIAIEAGVSDYWRKYVGLEGEVIGVDDFGKSAQAQDVYHHFGLTEEALRAKAIRLL